MPAGRSTSPGYRGQSRNGPAVTDASARRPYQLRDDRQESCNTGARHVPASPDATWCHACRSRTGLGRVADVCLDPRCRRDPQGALGYRGDCRRRPHRPRPRRGGSHRASQRQRRHRDHRPDSRDRRLHRRCGACHRDPRTRRHCREHDAPRARRRAVHCRRRHRGAGGAEGWRLASVRDGAIRLRRPRDAGGRRTGPAGHG